MNRFNSRRVVPAGSLLAFAVALISMFSVSSALADKPKRPTVVLVHGAFADGSAWAEVTPFLLAKGVKVVAIQNPLSSLTDDVAAAVRAIELQDAPVVLVGHSWGGTVITQAGNHEKVAALVYVAAFAPDAGESTNDTQKNYPPAPWVPLLKPDSAGFVYLPEETVLSHFAQDVPKPRARVIAATQGPIRGAAFAEKVTKAAWSTKPSWYLVADDDKMIYPDLQREFAKKLGSTVTTLKTSHVPFLSKPRETAAVILAAVNKVAAVSATVTEGAVPPVALKPPAKPAIPPPAPPAKPAAVPAK
jgi:pimeloyl-ACP methyl ester carboxylesterase